MTPLRRVGVLAAVLAVVGGGVAGVNALRSHNGTAALAGAGGGSAPGTGDAAGASVPQHPGTLLITRAGGGLAVVDVASGAMRPLPIPGAFGSTLGRATWSPDGRHIAFQANSDDADHVEVADADGHNVVDLTPTGAHVFNLAPFWSPDGTRIAFASMHARENPAIWTVTVIDHHLRRLTDGKAHDVFPRWSPDGRRVAFVRTVTLANGQVHAAVMVMNLDGTGLRPLVALTQADVTTPVSWSPDGTHVAFSDGPTNDMQIWTIDFFGRNLTRVSSDDAGHYDPAWSPDGKQLAFARFTAPRRGIYVIGTDGTGLRQVTDASTGPLSDPNGRLDGAPSWYP